MEFVNQTVIGKKELTALARGARKSIRRRRGHTIRIAGGAIILLNVFFAWTSLRIGDSRWWINGVLALFLLVVIFGEDQLNGRISAKYLLPDAQKVTASFGPEQYTHTTATSDNGLFSLLPQPQSGADLREKRLYQGHRYGLPAVYQQEDRPGGAERLTRRGLRSPQGGRPERSLTAT